MSATDQIPPAVSVPDRICDEDGTTNWFVADRVTRTQARRTVAQECGEPVGEFEVHRRWMRPATLADPDVYPAQIAEGWWIECDRREPGAFAVWRVD